jgi:hypothetical protein
MSKGMKEDTWDKLKNPEEPNQMLLRKETISLGYEIKMIEDLLSDHPSLGLFHVTSKERRMSTTYINYLRSKHKEAFDTHKIRSRDKPSVRDIKWKIEKVKYSQEGRGGSPFIKILKANNKKRKPKRKQYPDLGLDTTSVDFDIARESKIREEANDRKTEYATESQMREQAQITTLHTQNDELKRDVQWLQSKIRNLRMLKRMIF